VQFILLALYAEPSESRKGNAKKPVLLHFEEHVLILYDSEVLMYVYVSTIICYCCIILFVQLPSAWESINARDMTVGEEALTAWSQRDTGELYKEEH
jgi:hypothetical protein